MPEHILLTGGAGYIGSHTALELLNAGYHVVAVDNLCNSNPESLLRVEKLSGKKLTFIQADIRNHDVLKALLHSFPFAAVIHFAGLKAVGESVSMPVQYYDNNVHGSLELLAAMEEAGIRNIVFSSSATVYGDPESLPITEDAPLSTTNPYGGSKLLTEEILRGVAQFDERWNIALLRYFNPVGAHESGRIGEDPQGVPSNLMPYITQVAMGKLQRLQVFGNDYPTPDGTGVRDYIHVVDLALGHVRALEALLEGSGIITVNLGTGQGYSVLEMLSAFERVCGKSLPYVIVDRRPGDIASCYADPSRARQVLGWQAERDLDTMCRDAWRWQTHNPFGYADIREKALWLPQPVTGGKMRASG